jgi:ribosomal 50S subunit-recycling heat shock protein
MLSNKMLESVRLQAIHKEEEELRSGVSERPDVVLVHNTLVTLGKNSTTMIADSGMKRNTLQIRLEPNSKIRLVSVACGRVSVNGELVDSQTLCVAGDVISLHAPERAYDYEVVVEGAAETDDDDEASLPPPAALHAQPQQATAGLAHIAEEFTCAFCLDLQVQATTLVPCGHSFCKACVAQISECCSCRSKFHETVPCRVLDNVIASLVSKAQVFAADDMQVYQQRIQSAAAGARRSPRTKKLTPKKRKLTIAHVSGGSLAQGNGASAVDAISID